MVVGGTDYAEKPLPEEVCFNADRVPAEAVMLISPPCETLQNVCGGRGEMYHENL